MPRFVQPASGGTAAIDVTRDAWQLGSSLSIAHDARGRPVLDAVAVGTIDPTKAPYSAPFDGIADGTAELSAAIADAGTLGTRVWIPPDARIRTTAKISINAPVRVFSEGNPTAGPSTGGVILADHGDDVFDINVNFVEFHGINILAKGATYTAGGGIHVRSATPFYGSTFQFIGGSIIDTWDHCIIFEPDAGFYAVVAHCFLMPKQWGSTGKAGVHVVSLDPRAVPRYMIGVATYNAYVFDVSNGCENFLVVNCHGYNAKFGPNCRKVMVTNTRFGSLGDSLTFDGTNNVYNNNICAGQIHISPTLQGSFLSAGYAGGSIVYDGTPPPKTYNFIMDTNPGDPRIMGHQIGVGADDVFLLEFAAQPMYNKTLLAIGGNNREAPGTLYEEVIGSDGIVTFGSTAGGTERLVLGRREYPSDTLHEMVALMSAGKVVIPVDIDLMIGDPDPTGGGVMRLRRATGAFAHPRLTFGADNTGYTWGIAKNVSGTEIDLLVVKDTAGNNAVGAPRGLWNDNPILVGPSYIWDDGTSLRTKRGLPSSSSDGTAWGGSSPSPKPYGVDGWRVSSPAASTANTSIPRFGATHPFVVAADGTLTSAEIRLSAALTAGTITLSWSVNGTVGGGSIVIPTGTTTAAWALSVGLTAGDVLDFVYATSSGYVGPVTTDLTASITPT